MGIKEYGQAASEVELQDNPGPIKNQEGEAVIEVTNDQDVGIGTSTPRRKLDILDASNPQLRLSHTDDTEYVEFQSLSTGDAAVKMTDSIFHVRSGDAAAFVQVQNTTVGVGDGTSDGLSVGMNGYDAYLWNRETNVNATLNIGCGGASAITINNSNNTTAVNNLSANGNVTLGDAGADTHTLNGTLQFAQEVSSPSAPGAGAGGIFYVKDDGIPYFVSNSTAETALTGGGGGGLTYENKTSTFTAEGNYFYTVSTSGGDVTVNLPAASGVAGKTVDVCHKTIGNTITIDGNSSETINGATTLTLSGIAYQNVTLFCTGTEWIIR